MARNRLRAALITLATSAALLAAGPAAPPAGADTVPAQGADISWPQCPAGEISGGDMPAQGAPMPTSAAQFVVIGLTDGPGFTPDPCVASHVQWVAEHHLTAGAYAFLTYPNSTELARYGAAGPYGTATLADQLGNVGWAEAQYNVDTARRAGLGNVGTIFTDVEPGHEHYWSATAGDNIAVINGAMAAYAHDGYRNGLYSYPNAWNQITGGWRPPTPVWVTGSGTYAAALANCTSPTFSGAPAVLSQWNDGTRDYDVTCGGRSAADPTLFTYPGLPQRDLVAVAGTATGSGHTEVHTLTGASGYQQFAVHAATALGTVTPADWQFLIGQFHGDGRDDLFAVHLRGTASGRVEVHVLSAASGYTSWLDHAATALPAVPLGQWQFSLGAFRGDGQSDLIGFALNRTGSGQTEVHVLCGSTNFGTFCDHAASGLGQLDPSTWQLLADPGTGDLIAVAHGTATGSGHTEVHTLSAASGYHLFSGHYATPLGPVSTSAGEFTVGAEGGPGGPPDVSLLLTGQTGSGHTEVHTLTAASGYASFLGHWATALGPVPTSSWYLNAGR